MRLCPRCGIPITCEEEPSPIRAAAETTKTGDTLEASLVRALNDEIEYVKTEGGSRFYSIRNGGRISEIAGEFVYRFDFDGDALNIDVPVQLQMGNSKDRVAALIVSIVGQEIALAVKADLPRTIPNAKMYTDPLFILERLRDRIKSPPNNFNISLACKLFAEDKPNLGQISIVENDGLNESQRSAAEHSAGSEIFFIWGPPGTGKTKTIASIVSRCFASGGRVLVTSNTNVAVDNAISSTEKLVHKYVHRSNSDFPGDIVRVGVPQTSVPDCVLPDVIAKQKSKQIDKELGQLESEDEHLRSRIEQLKQDLAILNEYDRLNSAVASYRQALDQLRNDMELSARRQIELKAKIETAEKTSRIRRVVRGIDLDRLSTKLKTAVESYGQMQEQFSSTQRTYDHMVRLVNSTTSRAKNIAMTNYQMTQESTEASAKLSQNSAQVTRLREARKNIENEVIANAKIIGTTLAKTWLNSEIMNRRFDLVVVDEVSMATLPMLYFVAGLSNGRILVVGDFKQLPAITLAQTPHVKQWMKRDIFEAVGINVDTLEEHKNLCGMLTTQYRMNPDISRVVSKHFYGGRLQDHETVKRSSNIDRPPGAGYSLILLDTSNLNPWSMTRDESGSRINLIHAELAVQMAKESVKNGFTKLGIITPYRAQAKIITKRIEDVDLKKTVEVATVHRFQGREKEIVIFDVSDSEPYDPSQLIRIKNSEGNQSERLLNVAVSRAQDKLILIGNLTYLTSKLASDELLVGIIEDFKKYGIQLAGDQFLTYPSEVVQLAEPQEKIATYRAENFYPAFESDLGEAREDIVIVSAFVTARRVTKLEATLRGAIERNVSVRILTKPPEKQFDNEPMKRSAKEGVQILKDLGARVEFNPETHEKISVIDNSIVWYGSLNILSQYESSESMMRFAGEATARQLLGDVGLGVETILRASSFASVKSGMRSITTTGKVIRIDPVQIRRKRDGPTVKFAEAILEAEGNQCNLTLWNAETNLVHVGDTIRITNGYTREYNGKVSLYSGKHGKIEVL